MQPAVDKHKYQRTWGFRFSLADGIVLVITAVSTPWLVGQIGTIGLLPAFVVLHFFLFCNVFRIRRTPELIWGLGFVIVASVLRLTNSFESVRLMSCQLPLSVLLIVRETRHADYHGVYARHLNVQLDAYLAEPS